jgi:glycogen operon protein
MLAAGDELGHSQGGNNNPYCQDNAISWLAWPEADTDLLAFTRRLLALRRQWLPLRPTWYTGLQDASGHCDLSWLRRNGKTLDDGDWAQAESRVLGALIGAPGRGARSLLLLFNAGPLDTSFDLPTGPWQVLLDSATDVAGFRPDPAQLDAAAAQPTSTSNPYPLCARSVVLLAGPAIPLPARPPTKD